MASRFSNPILGEPSLSGLRRHCNKKPLRTVSQSFTHQADKQRSSKLTKFQLMSQMTIMRVLSRYKTLSVIRYAAFRTSDQPRGVSHSFLTCSHSFVSYNLRLINKVW